MDGDPDDPDRDPAIFSVKIWADLQNTAGDVLTLEAVGYQFGFQFRYPKLANPTTELHLPVNTPTTIHATSRDVIHGFWLPEFRQKVDMVPGLINTFRITPTRTGTYRVVCSEFCGVLHGAMKRAVVQSQQDFAKWFAAQGGQQSSGGGNAAGIPLSGGTVAAGQTLFGQKCSACHSTGPFDQKQVGPGLGNIFNDPKHPKLVNGADPNPQNVAKIIHDGYTGDIGTMPNAQTTDSRTPTSRTSSPTSPASQRSNGEHPTYGNGRTRREDRPVPRGAGSHPSRADQLHPQVHLLDRPQGHRDPVHDYGRAVLHDRGPARRDHPHALLSPNGAGRLRRDLQRDLLDARHDDGLDGRDPAADRRVRQLRDAAADRRARRRVPVAELGLFWIFPVAGILLFSSFLIGAPDAGWTEYPPISLQGPPGTSLWCVAIFLVGISSTLTGINFTVTILKMRAPGMTFTRMPLFVWAQFATSPMLLIATTALNGALGALFLERTFGVPFYDPAKRRLAGPVAAHVLVLFAPGRVHHDPAGVRVHLRSAADVLAQAGLRLQDDRVQLGRDRAVELLGVGAPHVHLGDGALAAAPVHDHHDGHRDPDRDQDLLVDGDAVGRLDPLDDARCSSRPAS